jgi:hypothetical protein
MLRNWRILSGRIQKESRPEPTGKRVIHSHCPNFAELSTEDSAHTRDR